MRLWTSQSQTHHHLQYLQTTELSSIENWVLGRIIRSPTVNGGATADLCCRSLKVSLSFWNNLATLGTYILSYLQTALICVDSWHASPSSDLTLSHKIFVELAQIPALLRSLSYPIVVLLSSNFHDKFSFRIRISKAHQSARLKSIVCWGEVSYHQ